MADLIDRDELKKHVCDMCDDGQRECKGDESCAILCWINDMPAKNHWVSCSDRLPEMPIEGLDAMYSDCCLVCDSHDWIGMAYCLTDGNKTWWDFADAQNKVKIEWTEVTHWMPLPEIPEPPEKE